MLRLAERPNLPIRRRLWLVAVWLTLWICSVGSATAEEHSSLPKPGDCALWAGQARLVARKLLEKATQTESPSVARFYVETAYQLSPAPSLLYNLGLLRLRDGSAVEAADLLRRYQAEVGAELPTEHRAAIHRSLSHIPTHSYEVDLVTTPGAVVFVDANLVGRAPLAKPLLLASGPHHLRVELGYRQRETTVTDSDGSALGTSKLSQVRLPLPNAVVLLAPEFSPTHQKHIATIFAEQGITLVPSRDRELLLGQVTDRTGCLTQPSCQIWIGEQLDVERVMVIRSIDLHSPSSERLSKLSLEVISIPQGAQLFQRQTMCQDCTTTRSEPYLHALARTVRRELPDLAHKDSHDLDEPAPVGFDDVPSKSVSPCALARGTARRLARRLLSDWNQAAGDEEARVRLETAYQLSPSPLLLYNLGMLYRQKGSLTLATDLLGRFVATAGTELTSERRAKADAVKAELREQTATVTLTGPDGAFVFVDGKLHGSLPLQSPLVLSTGNHRVSVEIGYRQTVHEVQLHSDDSVSIQSTLPDAVLILPDERVMATHPELLTVAQRAAEEAGLTVVPERDRELILSSLPDHDGCAQSLLCMRRVGRMLGAQSTIMLQQQATGSWIGRQVDSEDGALGSVQSERCRTCNSNDQAIRFVVKQLGSRRHVPRARPLIDTEPTAKLHLDGFTIGTGPQTLLLTEGQYQVTATFASAPQLSKLLNVPSDLSLSLRLPVEASRRHRLVLTSVGLSLVTSGAVLMATGIGLWSTSSPQLPDPAVEARGIPVTGPLLLLSGAVTTVAGGVILGRVGLSGLRELRSR